MNKVKLKIDKDEKTTIVEGADTGLGKILLAAGKVKIGGVEYKVKKPKK